MKLTFISLILTITFSAFASEPLNCEVVKEDGSSVNLVQDSERQYPYVYATVNSYDAEVIFFNSSLAVFYRKKNAGDVLSKTVIHNFKSGVGQKIEVSSPNFDSTVVCK